MKQLTVVVKHPFTFRETRWFLDRDLDDCMHRVDGAVIRKCIPVEGHPVLIEIFEADAGIGVKVLKGRVNDSHVITGYVAEWLDTDRDISPFYRLMHSDPDFAPLVNAFFGLHMVGIPDFFETLVWCVIGQQINLQFAYKVKRTLVEKYGQAMREGGISYFLFPVPEVLAGLSVDIYRSMGLTTRKAEYIIGIAEIFSRDPDFKKTIRDLKNETEMQKRLLEIRGVGEWTANYALMKSLRLMNCIPYGDAGVHIALQRLKGIPKKDNRAAVDAVFDRYEGWKTYLVYYLWRSLRQPVQPAG